MTPSKQRILSSVVFLIISLGTIFAVLWSNYVVELNAASVSWTGAGDGSSWSDPANWSSDPSLPGVADNVTINADVTVNIAQARTVNRINLGNGSGTTSPVLNFTYDAISGSPLTVASSFFVYPNATVTHNAGDTGVNGTISISAATMAIGGTIDIDEKGYSAENGGGAGSDISNAGGGGGHGGTGGNPYASVRQSAYEGTDNGDIKTPTTLGSGGGQATYGGQGGGAVQLDISGTLTVNGSITANGGDGGAFSITSGGGGAGGSVYLQAGTLSGSGTISANGGNGGNATTDGGGGGGGRIAIEYTTDSSSWTKSAYGGTGSGNAGHGGAGTVYMKQGTSNGDLEIDNNDTDTTSYTYNHGVTPIEGTFAAITVENYGHVDFQTSTSTTYSSFTWSNEAIVADNGATMSLLSGAGSLSVPSTSVLFANTTRSYTSVIVNGTISHWNNESSQAYAINLTSTGGFQVKNSSSINADGRGYQASQGTGEGVDSNPSGGASHGGTGGFGAYGSASGSTYGTLKAPVAIGSGGGGTVYGGHGGGAIRLTVSGTLDIKGEISADGADGGSFSTTAGGGGSGGSVYISAGTLTGTENISANGGAGGNATNKAGAGGGGRVSILYTSSSWSGSGLAYGGAATAPGYDAGAGTVFTKAAAASNGDLLIDNNDITDFTNDYEQGFTPIASNDFDTITVSNFGNIVINSGESVTYSSLDWSTEGGITDRGGTFALFSGGGTLSIPASSMLALGTARSFNSIALLGLLTHSNNQASETYKIDVTTSGDFTLSSGGSIDVTGRGYSSENGTGAGSDDGGWGSGAGYGGAGGASSDGGSTGGTTYGDENAPNNIGSGGGSDGLFEGGSGGGAVVLTVGGNLSIADDILADGDASPNFDGGGGSGGSIWLLVTGTFSGTGNLSANGGPGQEANAGAGGGGRIRYECGTTTWSGSTSVVTGSIGNSGSSGTVTNDCIANTAPSVASLTATPANDGTGEVALSFIVDDADDDDTVEVIVEYNIGSGWTKATITTDDAETISTFGDPDVNNSDVYPIGESGAYIPTSSGANTVSTIWEAGIDASGEDTETAQVRARAYDGTAEGSNSESATFDLDLLAPTPSSASYKDINGDGTIDRIDLIFSEDVTLSSYDSSDWSFPVAGDASFDDTSASATGTIVYITVTATANITGSATVPTITYTNNADRLQDAAGNAVITFLTSQTITDAAAPFLIASNPVDGATIQAASDISLTFSEAMNTGTFDYTISDDVPSPSVAWSSGDTVVTISPNAKYSAGTHTVTVITADAASGSPSSFGGAISAFAEPFSFIVKAATTIVRDIVVEESIEMTVSSIASLPDETIARYGSEWLVIDNPSTAISYSNGFDAFARSINYGGSEHRSTIAGAQAEFTFSGTGIRFIGYRDPAGSAPINIYIDDVLETVLEPSDIPAKSQSILFEKVNLPAGEHTIRIEHAGGEGDIVLDAFAYLPSELTDNSYICTDKRTLELELRAAGARDVIVSEDENFVGTNWRPFIDTTLPTDEPAFAANGERIETHKETITLSSRPGEKRIYVRFRGDSGTVSSIQQFFILFDPLQSCAFTALGELEHILLTEEIDEPIIEDNNESNTNETTIPTINDETNPTETIDSTTIPTITIPSTSSTDSQAAPIVLDGATIIEIEDQEVVLKPAIDNTIEMTLSSIETGLQISDVNGIFDIIEGSRLELKPLFNDVVPISVRVEYGALRLSQTVVDGFISPFRFVSNDEDTVLFIEYLFENRELVTSSYVLNSVPEGKIISADGSPISGASVRITDSQGVDRILFSDEMGELSTYVENGIYTIEIHHDGYESFRYALEVENNILDPAVALQEKRMTLSEDEGSAILPEAREVIAAIQSSISSFRLSPAGRAIEPILYPAAVVSIAGTFGVLTSGLNVLRFLQYLLIPASFLRRKNRPHAHGYVYNDRSNLPMAFTSLRLVNHADKRIVKTSVTDKEGRYVLIAPKGIYHIEVVTNSNIYPSAPIRVNEDKGLVTATIAIDQEGKTGKQLSRLAMSLLRYGGLGLSITLLIIYPSVLSVIIFGAQSSLLALWNMAVSKRPKIKWGVVMSAGTPVKQAIIRLMNSDGRIVETARTDAKGRYAFYVGEGMYTVLAEYNGKQVEVSGIEIERGHQAFIDKKIELN